MGGWGSAISGFGFTDKAHFFLILLVVFFFLPSHFCLQL